MVSYIRDQFSEEPCSLLYSHDLDSKAFSVATSFIPTMRIKQLKGDENSICYIDNDKNQNKIDFLMKHNTCDKSNTLFKDYDFIRNVSNNSKQSKSKNFPFEKCAIEVDKTLVTKNKLNSFWNNVEKAECDALFADLRAENGNLTEELNYNKNQIEILMNTISQKKRIITNNLKSLQVLTDNVLQKDQKVITINGNVNNLESIIRKLNKDLQILEKSYNDLRDKLSLSITQTSNDLQNNIKKFKQLESDYVTLETEYKKFSQEFQTLFPQYKQNYESYLNNRNQLRELLNDINNLNITLTQKQGLRDSCLSELNKCLNLTQTQRNTLQTDLGFCNQTISKLDDIVTKYRNDVNILNNSYDKTLEEENSAKKAFESCENDRELRQEKSNKLEEIIANWKKERIDCSQYEMQINSMNAEIKDILTWCSLERNDMKYFNDKNKEDLKNITETQQTVCKDLPLLPSQVKQIPYEDYVSRVETYETYNLKEVRIGNRVISSDRGTWPPTITRLTGPDGDIISKGFSWRSIITGKDKNRTPNIGPSYYYNRLNKYDTTYWGTGLVPSFTSANGTTYIVIGPRFWVSKRVTANFQAQTDDETFIYINGDLISSGKANPEPATHTGSFTFEMNKGYRVVVVHWNGKGQGFLKAINGFSEVVPHMIENPNDPNFKPKPNLRTIVDNKQVNTNALERAFAGNGSTEVSTPEQIAAANAAMDTLNKQLAENERLRNLRNTDPDAYNREMAEFNARAQQEREQRERQRERDNRAFVIEDAANNNIVLTKEDEDELTKARLEGFVYFRKKQEIYRKYFN